MSIAYQTYLESGDLINLFDWFNTFAAIICPDGVIKEQSKVLLARFVKAVSELNYCGFLKTTSKKTDHVAKLTFGY